jgi:pectinesterase
MVTEVREKKGIPVLMTPVMRRRFNEKGEFFDTHGVYPDLTRAVAKDLNVPLIDMHRKSEVVIKKYGEEGSKKLFMILSEGENPNYPKGSDDNTHFQPLGAEEMAKCAVEGIRETKLKVAKYLRW